MNNVSYLTFAFLSWISVLASLATPACAKASDNNIASAQSVPVNPPQTNLLRSAASMGATVLEGRGMLVNQAGLNIYKWTGARVDEGVLRSALDEVL